MTQATHPEPLPAIVALLGEPHARDSVVSELARRYSADYRVAAFDTIDGATAFLQDAAREGDGTAGQVALVLTDEVAAPAGGESLFTLARQLFPDVRRALVIEWGSWADPTTAQAVFQLMAANHIDYYLVRPRHFPDEQFHRSVTEFLLEWQRAANAYPRDIVVIGDDARGRVHELRRLLSRYGARFDSLDPTSEEGLRQLAEWDVAYTGVPAVRLADGRVITDPSNADLARTVGLSTELPPAEDGPVDLAIVGAGPGGLAAAVYAASEGLRTLVLERESVGGQAGSSSLIRNYLGFSRGISGWELSDRAYQQAWVFGAQFAHTREISGMWRDNDGHFVLQVAPDEVVHARSVVLSSGVSYRRLAIPDLDPYVGSAVFYGASAVEAKAQTGRIVHVVGGGNSAGQAALHLARYAASVFLIVRGHTLAESMSQYLVDELAAAGVRILTQSKVVGGGGSDTEGSKRLDFLVVQNRDSGIERAVRSDALFITIGAAPHTDWVDDAVLRDQWGYVVTGQEVLLEGGRRLWPHERPPAPLESSVPGFFAVGDVRRGSVKRVASAVGEGSVVVSAVHRFLAESAAATADAPQRRR